MILLGAAGLYFVSIIVGGPGLLLKDWTCPQGHGRSSRSTTELVSSVLCCSNLSRSLSDNLSLPFFPYFSRADGPMHTADKSTRIHLIQKPWGCSAPAEKIQQTWWKHYLRRFWILLCWILRNHYCDCLTRSISEKAKQSLWGPDGCPQTFCPKSFPQGSSSNVRPNAVRFTEGPPAQRAVCKQT